MNKYLLLRDNKQSGPYTVDELAANGLKAYDLVWLEGKSAAWRYPSEIPELRPFAPVVEEQPFDRFYKKPETKTIESPAKDNTRVQQSSSVYDQVRKSEEIIPSKQYVQMSSGSKKIHVSLPGAKSTEPLISKAPKEEPRTVEPSLFIPPVEKITLPSQPVLNDEPVSYLSSSNAKAQTVPNFEQAYNKRKGKETVMNSAHSNDAPVSKLLFRSVAAACLLLGGALIGLVVNYNSQQKKFQQLNQLVQEIKQQDDPGTAKNVKKDNLSNEVLLTQTNPKEAEQPNAEPEYKEDIQLSTIKKDRRDTKAIKAPDTTHNLVIPKVAPAVLEHESTAKKMDKVATELTKKNLWQLVSVDNNAYKTGVFGGISNLSLKLSNKSLLQLDQVEVEVIFLSPERKTVNKQKVIFSNVAPGEQLTIDVPKSSRGVKVEYSIKRISTKEFELAHGGL